MPEVVTEPAPAKINPFLRVLGRRQDGYHDIETLILPITLHDELTFTPLEDDLIWVMDVFGEAGGVPSPNEIPTGERNLAIIAAELYRSAIGGSQGAQIAIHKRIPVAAGLGGGSADAAATLRALGDAWGVGLGVERLAEVAAKIGSDVRALLHQRPCFVRGRGGRIDTVDIPPTSWVLVTQPFGVRSGDAYRWWDEADGRTGPDPEPLLSALASGDFKRAGGLLFNDLEPSVTARHPEISTARDRLLSSGALGAIMCGSGPTVVGLARNAGHAEELAGLVQGIAVASLQSK